VDDTRSLLTFSRVKPNCHTAASVCNVRRHAPCYEVVEFESELETGGWSFSTMSLLECLLSPTLSLFDVWEGGRVYGCVCWGGGRLDAVWRLRAPVQSERLRFAAIGEWRGGFLLPARMCAVQISARIVSKQIILKTWVLLIERNFCFRGKHTETGRTVRVHSFTTFWSNANIWNINF
jgi:hypothetical protein